MIIIIDGLQTAASLNRFDDDSAPVRFKCTFLTVSIVDTS
jgi:hypothetical protein